jgi:hypothetical protein
MAASRNPVAIRARARANPADMGARAHTVFASVRVDANAQYFYVRASGVCRDWREDHTSVK